MDTALAELIRISREVGAEASLVQGGGGNTSVKTADGEFMYVKASGSALKEMSETRGWRRLRLAPVLAILRDASIASLEPAAREAMIVSQLAVCCADEHDPAARPSVESHLHALLGRCVVHLHPTAVGAYVCAKEGRAHLEQALAEVGLPWLWLPFVHPGYTLAREVKRRVEQFTREHGAGPSLLFLEKHGVFISADSVEEARARTYRVIEACGRAQPKVKVKPARLSPGLVASFRAAVRKGLHEATGGYAPVRCFQDEQLAAFLARADAKRLASLPALTPDEMVYVGGSPLWVDRPEAAAIARRIASRLAAGDKAPSGFLAPGVGLLVAGTERTIPAIREVITASLTVRAAAASFGGPKPLTAGQRQAIAEWEGESFRRKVVGLEGAGELAGRIAIVTGAGSGLGRSIALGLARAGALVALADVDVAAAEATAGAIVEQGGAARAVRCDVTDEAAVAQAYQEVLAHWGGLDVLVNAAGIAPPYALVDLPVAKWRLALEINLTGYFLMAQAAARVMLAQGMGGSIVNLSSKSGLEASRNNTPYNATKAGELHLTRGWALELGESGIRVNAIAPGNVFEGSKIWNPAYIQECARKYGIAPEEVIPYYVNKTALKREITGRDIAEAVVFLCSDRARTITGQTLVVDGGQVMVR